MTRRRNPAAKPIAGSGSVATSAIHTPLPAETLDKIVHHLKIRKGSSTNPNQPKIFTKPALPGGVHSIFRPNPLSGSLIEELGRLSSLDRRRLERALAWLRTKAPSGKATQMAELSLNHPPELWRLLNLATNGFEMAAAFLFAALKPNLLSKYANDKNALFLFRCFLAPQIAIAEIGFFTPSGKPPPLWLFDPASYLLAFERMHLEMVLRRSVKPVNSFGPHKWAKPRTVEELKSLPQPTLDWFENPPEGCAFWMKRFDDWRMAARNSFLYYMKKQCKAIGSDVPELRAAALAGAIERDSPLPPELIVGILEHLKKLHKDVLLTFYKCAGEPTTEETWRERDLDTWMLEIWPLAVMEHWRDPDLLKLAKRKFPVKSMRHDLMQTGSIAKAEDHYFSYSEQIRSRRKKLRLELSPEVSKRGRPIKGSTIGSPLPPLALLAVFLESIGKAENYWFLGRRGLVR